MAIRGDIGAGSANIGGKTLTIDSPGLHSITCTLPDNIAILAPGFLVSAGNRIKIVAAKLELGSVQTLAHQDASGSWVLSDPPPNRALELAKCQRYQIALKIKQGNILGSAYTGGAGTVLAHVSLPTSLRSTPTISGPSMRYFQCAPNSNTYVFNPNTDITSIHLMDNQMTLFIKQSQVPAGTAGWVDTDENGTFIIDSNL